MGVIYKNGIPYTGGNAGSSYDDTEIKNDLNNKVNTADLADVATSGSYNDLDDKPTIPAAYDDTTLAGRVSSLESGKVDKVDGKVLSSNDYTNADKEIVNGVTEALADRYTKTEADQKIAEAMNDINIEHFHVVTTLPNPEDENPDLRPIENNEYVLVTYEPDSTVISTETHYLFYDGTYHERHTQISLEGYATEDYVINAINAQKARIDTLETLLAGYEALRMTMTGENNTITDYDMLAKKIVNTTP